MEAGLLTNPEHGRDDLPFPRITLCPFCRGLFAGGTKRDCLYCRTRIVRPPLRLLPNLHLIARYLRRRGMSEYGRNGRKYHSNCVREPAGLEECHTRPKSAGSGSIRIESRRSTARADDRMSCI